MKTFNKQPADVLDYDIDLSDWLTQGDNLNSADVSVDVAGLTVDDKTVSDDRLKIWLSGGTSGSTYKVTANLITEDGRTKQVDFKVRVTDE